jgi:hypothetical protein
MANASAAHAALRAAFIRGYRSFPTLDEAHLQEAATIIADELLSQLMHTPLVESALASYGLETDEAIVEEIRHG